MHGRRTDAGHSGHPPSTRSAWPASNGVPPDVDPLQECPVRAKASPPFPITGAANGTWCLLSDAAAVPNGTRCRPQRGADMTASAARRACETRSFPRSPETGGSPATRARRSGIMARMPARTRLQAWTGPAAALPLERLGIPDHSAPSQSEQCACPLSTSPLIS